jgi:undecaprenyl-diphosphatase
MNLISVIILSVVEGITEFLPVSSTGHLILTASLLRIPSTSFSTSFELFIQLGAILAVVVLFGRSALKDKQKLERIAYAFLPTAIIGFVLYKFIKKYLLTNPWVVVVSLAAGGIALIAVELWLKKRSRGALSEPAGFSKKQAVSIGLFQSLSVIPGVSRAAATIIGGQLAGLTRRDATEFSFLLAVPTMIAATGLDLVKSHAFSFTSGEFLYLGIGFSISFLTAFLVIRLFLSYVRNHSFIAFGVYRILIAVVYSLIVLHR